MGSINVTKASGETESYDESKLHRSLANAGANQQIIDKIADAIDEILYDGISTQKIYREAFRLLKKHSNRSAGRYKLKEALFELGPTGYPFEKFTAELLNRLGYSTEVGQIIEGNCVSHEIDVIAEKGDDFFIIECKFHNRKDHKCNVKVPLYIQSRFEDVKRKWSRQPGHKGKGHHGWVVTNTRFTDDAQQYGKCIGLNLLSWDYPKNNGLKDLISRVNLHPVTCLSTLKSDEKKKLLEQDIVFCQQLAENKKLLNNMGWNSRKAGDIYREAKAVASFNNKSNE